MSELSNLLLKWYDRHRRDLPWRGTADPYRVWLSEIMLQQTRVETVAGYYGRFLSRFPTVGDLARAETDEVLKLWEERKRREKGQRTVGETMDGVGRI